MSFVLAKDGGPVSNFTDGYQGVQRRYKVNIEIRYMNLFTCLSCLELIL
jgi:hypothetical protein